MIRRINFYSICFAFGLSILLILAGSRYTDNKEYRPSSEVFRNFFKSEYDEDDLTLPLPTDVYDGLKHMEKILNYTRAQVRAKLRNYNFSLSGVNKLDDLLLEEGGQPLRSVIISTWRSGSTFLGEILDAMPGNFYNYEPLLKFEIIQIRGSPYSAESLKLLKKMLNCTYEGLGNYFEYGRTHLHQFTHNSRLWDHCKYNRELCFDAKFTSRYCMLFPFQSMKVVRLRLHLVEDILKDEKLNARVVFLVRDPRAVMQSRQHRVWCEPAPDCWRPGLLCADMTSDYVAAYRLLQTYGDRLMVLRYEELALDPSGTTRRLFRFLGRELTPSVESFLSLHTSVEVPGVSSTFRLSRSVPFKWRSLLDYDAVEEIQAPCKEAMQLWGYNLVRNVSDMTSKDFEPMGPYTITV